MCEYDLAVVGGGLGGLAAAALAQNSGLKVVLLEAHTKLGGCAGWYSREGWTFDVGATALVGLEQGDPIGDLLDLLGASFSSARTNVYRVVLPDREISIVPNDSVFEANVVSAFPKLDPRSLRNFWKLQAAIGKRLLAAASEIPRFPLRSLGDLVQDLRILGLSGIAAAAASVLTVQTVLRLAGLNGDQGFRTFIDMLLQDTAQTDASVVPYANACACLQAYRVGMSRPIGTMRALVDAIAGRFVELGGNLRTAALVDRVEPAENGGFNVCLRRRGERVHARQVAFDLPLDLAVSLLGRPIEGAFAKNEKKSRAVWSAATAYLAVDRSAIDDDAPLFHQVVQSYNTPLEEGNNVLVSLSPAGDEGYGPENTRVVTLSTHTDPALWSQLDRTQHDEFKRRMGYRLLSALERALPGSKDALLHAEFGTPRSFARYTRRVEGRVGGPPASRSSTNAFAVGSDVLGKNLWLVGDSVFPGQGTLAVVVSAIRVVERITGQSWKTLRKTSPVQIESRSQAHSTSI